MNRLLASISAPRRSGAIVQVTEWRFCLSQPRQQGLMLRRYNLPHPSTDSVLIIYCRYYLLSLVPQFFRPVNRTTDEAPVQRREQLGTDGQLLTGLMPLYTLLPSSLTELHIVESPLASK